MGNPMMATNPVRILPMVKLAASFPTVLVSMFLLLKTYSLFTTKAKATPMTQDAALLMLMSIPTSTSAAYETHVTMTLRKPKNR